MFFKKYWKLLTVSFIIFICVVVYIFFRVTFVPQENVDIHQKSPDEKSQGGHWLADLALRGGYMKIISVKIAVMEKIQIIF
jgi:hypothetical protein